MKKLNQLSVGQQVNLKIVESQSDFLIVSFKGELLRVVNKTGQKFEQDKHIQLVVKKVKPIEFALPSKGRINVWV